MLCPVCEDRRCRISEAPQNFCRVTGSVVPNPQVRVISLVTGRPMLLDPEPAPEPEPEPEDVIEPEPQPELTRIVRTKVHKGKRRR